LYDKELFFESVSRYLHAVAHCVRTYFTN
jgi:hypothetical protein